MSFDEILEEISQNNYINLNHINYYKEYSSLMPNEVREQFLSTLENKMISFGVPFFKVLLGYISGNLGSYSRITNIVSIHFGSTVIISGKDENGLFQHNLISSNYVDACSYDPYTINIMFCETRFYEGEITFKDLSYLRMEKINEYHEYASILNEAFGCLGISTIVKGGDGNFGALEPLENGEAIYVRNRPKDIIRKYNSKKEGNLFDFILVDSNNCVSEIIVFSSNGVLMAEQITIIDYLIDNKVKKIESK